ncbi:MATE family efflux transporter [Halocatena salina]|uniref:Polysaccharide biosynthesis C-terminal domain-containing protein n=1 Tax=Halocatena salina TaxID=2934340 RepID=A0A8U0A5I4_9EURY|nr:polysaccharide biosynthesis C-terminal domain-containing protein [Halocatena salina]UPM44445.1 polysaccharide biosynthesis C-terminal domain-containing protein [Halocatena salina]
MNYTKILRSSLGTFVTRVGLSVAVFLGIFYLAVATTPVVLGIYSLFIAVIRALDLLTNVGITEAAQKRISEGTERDEYFTATLVVRLGLFAPVGISVAIYHQQIATYIGSELVVPFLFAGSFAFLVRKTIESGLIGEKKVAQAGLLQFIYATGQLASWIFLVSLGYGLFGVLVGYVVGQLVASGVGMILLTLRLKRPTIQHFRSLFEFAKYSWVGAVTTQSWIWTDTLVLGIFVVPSFIGVYELGWQITGVLFLLASAISSTLFANISELSVHDEAERITDLLERSLVYTGILAIPGMVGGMIFAEPLLAIFGEEYRIGATVVVVLILSRVFHSYEVVFGKVINALDRPDLMFRTNVVFILFNLVFNVLAVATIGWLGAALATTGAMVLKTGLSYYYIRSLLTFSIPIQEILLEILSALIMGFCLWLLVPVSSSLPPFETIVFIGVGAAIYAASVLILVERIRVATADMFRTLLLRMET